MARAPKPPRTMGALPPEEVAAITTGTPAEPQPLPTPRAQVATRATPIPGPAPAPIPQTPATRTGTEKAATMENTRDSQNSSKTQLSTCSTRWQGTIPPFVNTTLQGRTTTSQATMDIT